MWRVLYSYRPGDWSHVLMEVTCIQCGFGEYGGPYCLPEFSHRLGTGCQLIFSTHRIGMGCISIWNVVDMVCRRHGLDTQRVYQTGLGSFRRVMSSWHPTVRSEIWRGRISMGRVMSPKQSGRITLMQMGSVVAGQEV